MDLDYKRILDNLDHLPWWQALSIGASAGVLLAVVGLDLLGGWWGLGIGVAVLGGVVWLCWDVEPLLVLEGVDEVESEAAPGDAATEQVDSDQAVHPGAIVDGFQLEIKFAHRIGVRVSPELDARLPMNQVPGGTFLMGSSEEDDLASDSERPEHRVMISTLALSETTITRGLYRELMDRHPERWDRDEDDDRLPANYLSWFDAVRFCNRLSDIAGFTSCYEIDGREVTWNREADGYRLPTEAEWEYACRAGTTTRWYWGDEEAGIDEYVWYEDNAENRVHSVGEKKANPWGLHDMAGNVWEWCWDWFGSYQAGSQEDPIGPPSGTFRLLRGGAFPFEPWVLRSAYRDDFGRPEFRAEGIGFRVACSRRPP